MKQGTFSACYMRRRQPLAQGGASGSFSTVNSGNAPWPERRWDLRTSLWKQDLQQLPCTTGSRPEPRMGHVAAILGDTMVVHGGRTAPDQALADVWALDLPSNTCSPLAWRRPESSAMQPAPRHRHSAVVARSESQARLLPETPISLHCHASYALLGSFPGMSKVQLPCKMSEWKGPACTGKQDGYLWWLHTHWGV